MGAMCGSLVAAEITCLELREYGLLDTRTHGTLTAPRGNRTDSDDFSCDGETLDILQRSTGEARSSFPK